MLNFERFIFDYLKKLNKRYKYGQKLKCNHHKGSSVEYYLVITCKSMLYETRKNVYTIKISRKPKLKYD